MNELKHWLDEASEADEFERAILRAGLDADPPGTKQDQVWSGLMATLAVVPLTAATTSAQAVSAKAATAGLGKAAAVLLAVTKGFVVGLAIYGAEEGVSEISRRLSAEQAPAKAVQRATARPTTGSRVAEPQATASTFGITLTPAIDDAPSTRGSIQRGSVDPSANALARNAQKAAVTLPSVTTVENSELSRGARVSQLEAEARALRQARDELRTNRLVDAFATLEASRRQFPAPELDQEREALMIELLYRSGQATAGEQRAEAFLRRFPESPHLQQIKRLVAH